MFQTVASSCRERQRPLPRPIMETLLWQHDKSWQYLPISIPICGKSELEMSSLLHICSLPTIDEGPASYNWRQPSFPSAWSRLA